ncbi:conserved hypothetical protein [Rhodococcus sp. RD6.2]|jgi:hypothetical protein|uniref:hypothetical protein n=1 Tax=Rhodococcus sp. RD6.2 TaxID=260936 RepID=UPI00063B8035|nr:hypothetical protein [Rhodococcus sp. RD6.2]CRK50952.1 conserved hypothetical protein [Rhodococcus sp. RD6.2]
MSSNATIRLTHRWTSIVFTVTVVLATIAVSLDAVLWLSYLPLLPLAVLLFSGLYLFVLPYRRRAAAGRRPLTPA